MHSNPGPTSSSTGSSSVSSSTLTTSSTSAPAPASSTAAATASTSNPTSNLEQYHYPPISTLRRPSRPSNIDLSLFDINSSGSTNDPGIYSAPLCPVKQYNPNHHAHAHSPHMLPSHPQTATFHYQPSAPPQQQQHLPISSHYHHPHSHNMHSYQQSHHNPPNPQQQTHLLDPYAQHQHTPHTFPLQASSNQYHHYFHFPPSNQILSNTTNSTPPAYNPLTNSQGQSQLNLQGNVSQSVTTSNNGSSQPSTPTHKSHLLAVQLQDQSNPTGQPWSNSVLSPLMVKRMNENPVVNSMTIDDDEDPSASIDALVADVDSTSHDLLDDQTTKSVDDVKPTSTPSLNESRTNNTSPSPNLYLRGTSHILTTPPNPLASTDHSDNPLTVNQTFNKTFSPIPSAGFELTNPSNGGVSSLSSNNRTSFFTFDTPVLEQHHRTDRSDVETKDECSKPLILNNDERNNCLNQDENSSHSSSNSASQTNSSRNLSQILQAATDKNRLSPLNNDVKISLVPSFHSKSSSSSSSSSQMNRHFCNHPDCNKIFANKSALAKHKLTHCQDRKHKCLKCNKGFKRLDHLHGHMLTHEEEKPHKCRVPDCNRTYCDARSLKRHIENAHQNILAAIHEGGHEEYRSFLPETACVKTKDLSTDLSLDSTESNSPRSSSLDNDQVLHSSQQLRSNGTKSMTTYTFEEEKSVECQICKKTFKSTAALNGHMRLHGGFNDKQQVPSSSSSDPSQRKKRSSSPNVDRRTIKRKRGNSPISDLQNRPLLQRSMPIKTEEDDMMMLSSPMNNHLYSQQQHQHQHQHQQQQQQQMYSTLPPCSEVLHPSYQSQRIRSVSSSVLSASPHQGMKAPLSVQPMPNNPMPKPMRKPFPFPTHWYDRNNNHRYSFENHFNDESMHGLNNSINLPNPLLCFENFNNPSLFPAFGNFHSDERMRKAFSADEAMKFYPNDRQINGLFPSKHPPAPAAPAPPGYYRSQSVQQQQHSPGTSHFSQFSVPSPANPSQMSTLNPNLLQDILRRTSPMLSRDFLPGRGAENPSNDLRYRSPPSNSPYYHSPSPMAQSTLSSINTPVQSPSSDIGTNPPSNYHPGTPSMNIMQPSPSMIAAPKKRILSALKQEAQDGQQKQSNESMGISKPSSVPEICTTIEEEKPTKTLFPDDSTLKITPIDSDSPASDSAKKSTSGFLINTPSSSSTGTNSSSSSSSSKRFFTEETNAAVSTNPSSSSFQWPGQVSQFRRPIALNPHCRTPSTPYTPPPMLSPFRKGPGLYYQVFPQTASTPTPSFDEIPGPKINVGEDYQAIIPELKTVKDRQSPVEQDELLFSPYQLPFFDEYALEKYEQLSRTNPLLFSPRHSPSLYPIELVYMLLYEYQGDLQRTLAALLDGTVHDIKQCRPLHRYHFPQCDPWTNEEIQAFSKALETSEKNFQLISQAVGTKTVKQCIEFYYIPKVNWNARSIIATSTPNSSLAIKRKRLQMIRSKQQRNNREQLDDDRSNEGRQEDDPSNSIHEHPTHFFCDIDQCSEIFTSERAYRAHRHEHRRIKSAQSNAKRCRPLDSNK